MKDKKKILRGLEGILGKKEPEIKVRDPKEFLESLAKAIKIYHREIADIVYDEGLRQTDVIKQLGGEYRKLAELFIVLKEGIEKRTVEKVEITNFPKPVHIPKTEIPPFPKEVNIKKPSWWQRFDEEGLVGKIGSLFKRVPEGFSAALERHTLKENAFAVRLVDKSGQSFYDAMFQAIAGGMPNNLAINNWPADFPDAAVAALLTTIDVDTGNIATNTSNTATRVNNNVKQATTPNPYNITMTNANTEYSQALPANTKKFTFQCRGAYDMRYAFTTGKVAGSVSPYFTIKAGMNNWEDNLLLNSKTLYVACSTAGQVCELMCWT